MGSCVGHGRWGGQQGGPRDGAGDGEVLGAELAGLGLAQEDVCNGSVKITH